ncbi:MAG: hypothetical protein DPW09_33280 [Anaerolineae bacterium]|nr:hypothetical protein [Anaerolineales bacterium]MCQ3978325.1 hypothetical protein [Anaerolineae bacterium]
MITMNELLPFTARFKLTEVLEWETMPGVTIRETLIKKANDLIFSQYGLDTLTELEMLDYDDRLTHQIHVEEGDGYMVEGDEETVYHDPFIVVTFSDRGETSDPLPEITPPDPKPTSGCRIILALA